MFVSQQSKISRFRTITSPNKTEDVISCYTPSHLKAYFGDVIVQNWMFWTIGEQYYIVYYPIISYRKIKVYRVETIDMGRSHWNNDVSGTILLEQWCQWNYGTYCTRYDTLERYLQGYVRMWSHTLNNV